MNKVLTSVLALARFTRKAPRLRGVNKNCDIQLIPATITDNNLQRHSASRSVNIMIPQISSVHHASFQLAVPAISKRIVVGSSIPVITITTISLISRVLIWITVYIVIVSVVIGVSVILRKRCSRYKACGKHQSNDLFHS